MHRPARETLRLAVFDSERARVRSSRLLRASEREREPQEREREKERASSRATLVQKVSETLTQRRLLLLFLVCGRKKRVALLLVLVKIGWVISVERRHKKKLGVENYSIEQQTTTTTTSVPRRALEFESPWDRARAAASTRAHLLRRLARGRRSSSFFFSRKQEREKEREERQFEWRGSSLI